MIVAILIENQRMKEYLQMSCEVVARRNIERNRARNAEMADKNTTKSRGSSGCARPVNSEHQTV